MQNSLLSTSSSVQTVLVAPYNVTLKKNAPEIWSVTDAKFIPSVISLPFLTPTCLQSIWRIIFKTTAKSKGISMPEQNLRSRLRTAFAYTSLPEH